jgi:hypothetical protein
MKTTQKEIEYFIYDTEDIYCELLAVFSSESDAIDFCKMANNGLTYNRYKYSK